MAHGRMLLVVNPTIILPVDIMLCMLIPLTASPIWERTPMSTHGEKPAVLFHTMLRDFGIVLFWSIS